MQSTQGHHPGLRIFRDALLSVMIILLSVGILHLLAGWKTIHQYGNALVWAGAIGVILLLVGAGWRDNRRQDMAALSKVMREHEVYFLLNRDLNGRARFMLTGLITLLITLAIGLILFTVR